MIKSEGAKGHLNIYLLKVGGGQGHIRETQAIPLPQTYTDMKQKFFTLVALVMMSGTVLHAQLDTAGQKRDSLIVKYMLSSDFTFTAGNLLSFTTINKGQLELEKRVIGWKLLAAYRYGTLDSVTNSNELNISTMISLFPRNIIYGFVNGGVETSFLRGITLRAYGGIGAGFRVIKTETNEFEPFVNGLYEYNRYKDPLPTDTISPYELQTFRGVVGWTGLHKVFKKKLIIMHNFKYTQSLTIANNYRIEGNLNLALPIIKIFSLKAGFSATYENVVPVDRKQADFIWTIGAILTNM